MGKKAQMLKRIRRAGIFLMIIGFLVGGLLTFTTEPKTSEFTLYTGFGAAIFCLGALMTFGYEVFVSEFWKGTWVPGPGHEYPEDP
ncbi:MAG: hypothetical protein QXV93_05450 [Zestosphaera sp.]